MCKENLYANMEKLETQYVGVQDKAVMSCWVVSWHLSVGLSAGRGSQSDTHTIESDMSPSEVATFPPPFFVHQEEE